MSRAHLKSYSEYALLVTALLTGSLLTTWMPAGRPHTGPTNELHTTANSGGAVDTIGFEVDARRLSEIACVI